MHQSPTARAQAIDKRSAIDTPTPVTRAGRLSRGASAFARRIRWFLASFRLQLLWWFIAVLAIATVASVLMVRVVLIQGIDARVDAELRQEVEEVRRLAGGVDPATSQPFGNRVDRIFDVFLDRNIPSRGEALVTWVGGELHRRSGERSILPAIEAEATRWTNLRSPDRGTVASELGDVDYLAVPFLDEGEPRGVFVVAVLTEALGDDIEAASVASAGVGLVMLLIGSLLAGWLANRILRPVAELNRTARSISETDLTQRIDLRGHDEISQLAGTFNAMLDRLQAAFTTQGEFINDAGHQLRTPITVIRGHLDVMGDDPKDRAQTIELVNEELDRVGRIVDDLLTLVHAERPDFVQPHPTVVARLTETIFAKARALDSTRAWALDGVADITAEVDGQRLTEAVLQLAENAVRYAGPSAEIGIGSAVEADDVRFWVRDGGVGIAPAEHGRIFDRFHRGKTSRRTEGAGLGLSIVRAIAEAHGGVATVASAPGRGSTFTIVVPISGPAGR